MFNQLDLENFDEQRRQLISPSFSNSTKWKRINESVLDACRRTKTAKPLFEVIQYVMKPENFLHDSAAWNKNIKSLNETLIFYGYKVADSGKVLHVKPATTFSEAEQRLQTLNEKLSKLNIHPDIIKYCRPELLEKNYFHAILEASKGILDRVRQISGLSDDGNSLINKCFGVNRPIILIRNNLLKTQTERSKYQGLKSLLNTIVYLYRNPNAHDLKLYDVTSETDAITAFTLMSLANSLLDNCINVRDLD
jgi:uncharacterized protein (TIGR02391 family)